MLPNAAGNYTCSKVYVQMLEESGGGGEKGWHGKGWGREGRSKGDIEIFLYKEYYPWTVDCCRAMVVQSRGQSQNSPQVEGVDGLPQPSPRTKAKRAKVSHYRTCFLSSFILVQFCCIFAPQVNLKSLSKLSEVFIYEHWLWYNDYRMVIIVEK